MTSVNLTNPQFCERYEYINIPADAKIRPDDSPAGGTHSRSPIVFQLKDRSGIYDWANGYFLAEFKVYKKSVGGEADATTGGIGVGDPSDGRKNAIGIVNDSSSFISRISLYSQESDDLFTVQHANRATNLKKNLEISPDYAGSLGQVEFFYKDDKQGSPSDGATPKASTNSGWVARNALVSGGQTVQCKIPLKWYSFFDALRLNNVYLSGMSVRLEVILEEDNRLLWKSAALTIDGNAPAAKVVFNKFELWLPNMTLHPEGSKMYMQSIERPISWTYLRERAERFQATKTKDNTLRITSVVRPRKVFLWFVNKNNDTSPYRNSFTYNTFNIGGYKYPDQLAVGTNNEGHTGVANAVVGSKINNAYLEMPGGEQSYPRVAYQPIREDDIVRAYDLLMRYNYNNNDHRSGSNVSYQDFAKEYLVNCLYFDLDYQRHQLTSDARDLNIVYSLDAEAPEDYIPFTLTLYENQATYSLKENSFHLLTQTPK
jgi:hypothetical protein